MSTLAAVEAVLLVAIAVLHAAWGFGLRWPRRDEAALVALVVGYRHERMPSPSQCFVAASAIFAAGVILAWLSGYVHSPLSYRLIALLGLGMMTVFAGRGIAGYVPAWRDRFPRQPFATLDRWIYSPLCLAIAATCAILIFNQMRS